MSPRRRAREIREADGVESRFDPRLPIIVRTGRGGATDRVRGLDLGADDYVQKPFSYGEMRARITAILRRGHSRREGPVRIGELLIDPADGKSRSATARSTWRRKTSLSCASASDPTGVFSKDELLRDAWGPRAPAGQTLTLDSHASRLRRKLDPEHQKYVVNCWGERGGRPLVWH